MDRKEIARRLEEVRDQIREQLASAPPVRIAEALSPETTFELGANKRAHKLPRSPSLNSTAHLDAANGLAVISGPAAISSNVPLVGPLLTLLRRLARPLVQPLIDPYLDRQERFNVEVVRHLNELGQRTEQRLGRIGEAVQEALTDPGFIEARLDAALSDYDEALRQRHIVLFDALEEELWSLRTHLLAGDDQVHRDLNEFDIRFVERAQAVDRRFDEKDRAFAEAQALAQEAFAEALRARSGGAERAELYETREHLTRVLDEIAQGSGPSEAGVTEGEAPRATLDAGMWRQLRAWMRDVDYRAFQDRFRGDAAEIADRMRGQVSWFEGLELPIVDLGCGRGEFLELLEKAGHRAIGVEINGAEVESCTSRGLTAEKSDLFDWLEAQDQESVGGLFLAQVIEHLPPPDWSRFVRLAVSRLAPGGRLVVETINPESVYALVRAYVIDPTHIRPVHPELLSFFAYRAGFADVTVHYQSEVAQGERVTAIDVSKYQANDELLTLVRELNDRLHRIDTLCCAPQEYTLVATRAGGLAPTT